jgi:tRNA pseudouridine55 synthase|tara:strand:- start:4016 stop:4849 length:834 start_codon:yes stop_codon:yes gene_type:complete
MLVIDKSSGVTSHDVVSKLRKRFGERRIGHAGTLDPSATGVLIIGVGKATRLMRFATASTKTYETEIVFGVETDTLDADGKVVLRHNMSFSSDDLLGASKKFLGDVEQIPPMVSALKVDGRRLHELAREGIEIEREARKVRIERFDLTPTENPLVWRALVVCGPGTYIRSLGADLGKALGGGAHITNLRRTASGSFSIAEAQPVDDAELKSVGEMVRSMARLTLDDSDVAKVRNGALLPSDMMVGEGPWALFDGYGELVAVHERIEGIVKVGVVLPV